MEAFVYIDSSLTLPSSCGLICLAKVSSQRYLACSSNDKNMPEEFHMGTYTCTYEHAHTHYFIEQNSSKEGKKSLSQSFLMIV